MYHIPGAWGILPRSRFDLSLDPCETRAKVRNLLYQQTKEIGLTTRGVKYRGPGGQAAGRSRLGRRESVSELVYS